MMVPQEYAPAVSFAICNIATAKGSVAEERLMT